MSGQPSPPRIIEAFAASAPSVAAPNGTPGAKTAPFPATSQIGILNGAASLPDGFPPLTMTDPSSGGIPPFGEDMNGILYLLSAWVAFLAAGQYPVYDATLAAAIGGYAQGAILQQTADPAAYWVNGTAGNSTNPDTGGAGWVSSKPLYATPAAATGSNYALPGMSDYILGISTASGAVTLSGLVAQRDGQTVTFIKSSSDANALTLAAVAGSAGNQILSPGDLVMGAQYAAFTVRFNATLNAWVVV